MLPEFGKHAFVIWASYSAVFVVTAILIIHALVGKRGRK